MCASLTSHWCFSAPCVLEGEAAGVGLALALFQEKAALPSSPRCEHGSPAPPSLLTGLFLEALSYSSWQQIHLIPRDAQSVEPQKGIRAVTTAVSSVAVSLSCLSL